MLQLITAAAVRAASYALCSLTVAALALLFQECLKPPMIFARYKLWLLRQWRKNWRRNDRWKRKAYLLKPLGLCIYCNASWIATAYYLVTFGMSPEILTFLGMTFLWIKIFVKLGLK